MNAGPQARLRVAWISYFPVEWLPELPPELTKLPRQHPATWQRVLLNEFALDSGLDLHICAVRKQFPKSISFRCKGATLHCVKVSGGARTLTLFWQETLFLKRLLQKVQPDVVHAWGSERGAALVASRLRRPYLASMQGLLQWYQQQHNDGLLPALEARLEHTALKRARIVSAEASFSVQWLRDHYPHLDVRHVEHSPDWLFHKVRRTPDTEKIRFTFVGGVSHRKGCDLLLDAMERIRNDFDFRLVLVGGIAAAFRPRLSQVSSELKGRMEFKENLPPAEVANELARATIALVPSKADTGPVAAKEAAVAGVPMVGSRIGGIPDYVTPGKNGYIFEPGDLDGFVNAIRMAARHPQFRMGMVDDQSLARVRQHLSPSAMAEGFRRIYDQISGGKGTRTES